MSKIVWSFDDQNKLIGNGKTATDDYVLGQNETEVAPPSGLFELVWTGTEWTGKTAAEWLAANPVTSEPTTEQQALTAIAQQVADQQQYIKSLEQALTALAKGSEG